jgi:hypothetical protein
MDQNGLDAAPGAECRHQRRDLHEVRPGPCDTEDFHDSASATVPIDDSKWLRFDGSPLNLDLVGTKRPSEGARADWTREGTGDSERLLRARGGFRAGSPLSRR